MYPKPAAGTKLAIREHYNKMPAGMPVTAGCEDGKPARSCIEMLGADEPVVMPPTGGNITDYAYIAVYEPASNGAYFLGELNKFVHVSPQRFESVLVGPDCGPCVSCPVDRHSVPYVVDLSSGYTTYGTLCLSESGKRSGLTKNVRSEATHAGRAARPQLRPRCYAGQYTRARPFARAYGYAPCEMIRHRICPVRDDPTPTAPQH